MPGAGTGKTMGNASISSHAQIDLQNSEIPAKAWVVDLSKNPKPRPGGPTFVIGNIQTDDHDCYDAITTAGNYLPESKPRNPDKARYTLRDRARLALLNVAKRL
jgi:hypothetical protein